MARDRDADCEAKKRSIRVRITAQWNGAVTVKSANCQKSYWGVMFPKTHMACPSGSMVVRIKVGSWGIPSYLKSGGRLTDSVCEYLSSLWEFLTIGVFLHTVCFYLKYR